VKAKAAPAPGNRSNDKKEKQAIIDSKRAYNINILMGSKIKIPVSWASSAVQVSVCNALFAASKQATVFTSAMWLLYLQDCQVAHACVAAAAHLPHVAAGVSRWTSCVPRWCSWTHEPLTLRNPWRHWRPAYPRQTMLRRSMRTSAAVGVV
jgi:hypothetical protein